ncbi:hypothetical protein KX729_07330 [Rhizobium sp. XQZ8]|uniref:hypothetical protein n=1 Tax=Rhizobium populisoli TaxID=2859785 RepID=UPI001CA4AE58|nr:hypothetical protein [Rhizobium populisoli]MBW6421249.1 hypothetical protein [Rhizobium populisoli]
MATYILVVIIYTLSATAPSHVIDTEIGVIGEFKTEVECQAAGRQMPPPKVGTIDTYVRCIKKSL